MSNKVEMDDLLFTILIIIIIAFAVWVGAYAHESDLIRQCKEQSALKLWHGGYTVECKLTHL
jgi:hypothetical protein